jgi:hypothetical protein
LERIDRAKISCRSIWRPYDQYFSGVDPYTLFTAFGGVLRKDLRRAEQERHRAWSKDSDDIEINCTRSEIIDLIEKMIAHYDHLLEALRKPIEGD